MKIYVKHPDNLKTDRIKRGYTQMEFAKKIGISNVRLCQIENEPMSVVGVHTANAIISFLKCEWGHIFEIRR